MTAYAKIQIVGLSGGDLFYFLCNAESKQLCAKGWAKWIIHFVNFATSNRSLIIIFYKNCAKK